MHKSDVARAISLRCPSNLLRSRLGVQPTLTHRVWKILASKVSRLSRWDGSTALEVTQAWLETGEEADFYQVYQHWHGFVRAIVQTHALRTEDVDEVVQDVFKAVHSSRRRLEVSYFEAWLRTVTQNKVRDRFRRRHGGHEMPLEPSNPKLVDDRPGPERSASAREIAALLKESLEELPPQQRRCMLFRLQGLSHAETAVQMKIATGTVKATLSQARKALRTLLRKRGLTDHDIGPHLS